MSPKVGQPPNGLLGGAPQMCLRQNKIAFAGAEFHQVQHLGSNSFDRNHGCAFASVRTCCNLDRVVQAEAEARNRLLRIPAISNL